MTTKTSLAGQRVAVADSIGRLLSQAGRADDRGDINAMATMEAGAVVAQAILTAADTIAAALDRQPA